MILIGMYDSPFVRRVAVTLKLMDVPFEHKNWSVGKDQALIRKYNPLGRVPTLVLDDGEILIESSAILDYLDDRAGRTAALLPVTGVTRRRALNLIALATGAAEKGVLQLYERAFRPEDKRHEPWLQRLQEQMHGALAELEGAASRIEGDNWLVDEGLTQADVTVACVFTFLDEALKLPARSYPALRRHVARCEALPAFKAFRLPFHPPAAAG